MKRVLILVLAVVLLLSLAACSNKNNQNNMGVSPNPGVTTGVNMSPNVTTGVNLSPGVTTGNVSPGVTGGNTAASNTFVGSVSEVNGRTIVVTPDDGQDIKTNGNKISVSLDRDHNFVVGDKVRVTYDGNITGTNPATVNATSVEEVQ